MIRRLIILLLIVGCSPFKQEICVLKDPNINDNNIPIYYCYLQTGESECIDNSKDYGFDLIYMGDSYDCDEYCNSIPDEICKIQ